MAWDESKHPRGQPENAGQFGPGGGHAAAATNGARRARRVVAKVGGRDPRLPAAGSTIKKTWRGMNIEVIVGENGFEWNGKQYKSLSRIAWEIIGGKPVNGFLFFGLTKGAQPAQPAPAVPAATPAEPDHPTHEPARDTAIEGAITPEALDAAGLMQESGGVYTHKSGAFSLKGPGAENVARAFVNHPKAMEDKKEGVAFLRSIGIRLVSHSDPSRPSSQKIVAGAVAAFATLRAMGVNENLSAHVRNPYKPDVLGWYTSGKTEVNCSSDHPTRKVAELGIAHEHGGRYERPWTWGKTSIASTWVHEVGHMLHNTKSARQYTALGKAEKDPYSNGAFPWADDQDQKSVLREGWKSGQISKYGSSSPREFIAETFCRKVHRMHVSAELMNLYKSMGGAVLEGWDP